MMSNLDFDLPYRASTSSRRCSQGSSVLVVGFKPLFYKIEIDKYFWKIHSKVTMMSYISMFLQKRNYQTFLHFFINAQEYINPFVHFVFYETLCSSNFQVELHLGDVLEVLLGVGSKFYKTGGWIIEGFSEKIRVIAL